MTDYIIELKNVSKSFHGQQVIHNVDMNIKKGEIYGFIGSNGAGKTTIMKMMLGLIEADAGEIKILGSTVNEDNFEIKKQIGSIIENPFFYEKLSGRKNLEIHAKYMGFDDKNAIDEVLGKVSLTQAAEKKVSQYSLGMKQRLAIARAILTKPQILILDEPINALDPQGIVEMRNLFEDLSKKNGMTILISSHILSEVEHIVDRIGIIKNGCMIKEIENKTYQQEYIELIVEKPQEVGKILESKNISYDLKDEKHFLIKADDISVEELSVLMIQNHITLLGVSKVKKDLEDYFFEVTA